MFLVIALILILGCSSTSQPVQNPLPDKENVLLLCVNSGDPGCLGYATHCKLAWKVDPSCQPLIERCGQNWMGMIGQACRIAFGEEMGARQEQLQQKIESPGQRPTPPQPLPTGNYEIKEVVTQDAPKAKVVVVKEGESSTTYICDVELPEGCNSPKSCGILNRQNCFPEQ